MTTTVDSRTENIRALNNRLRQQRIGGQVVVTPGVLALGTQVLLQIQDAVARFDAFSPDNDPHGEHDFGSVAVDGNTVFFKIEYLDQLLRFHSPDPADPNVTRRIMILMLANEY